MRSTSPLPEPAGSGAASAAVGAKPLRLLVAAPFGPRFDNRHGGRVIAQLVKHLAATLQVALIYPRFPGHRPIDPALAAVCDVVVEVRPRRVLLGHRWMHRLNVLEAPVIGRPPSASALFSTDFAKSVRRLAETWQPDVIQFEHDNLAYCARFTKDLPCARLLVCHDPGLQAAEHLAKATRGRQRIAHRVAAGVWRRYWRSHLAELDAVVAFTEEDSNAIRVAVPELRVVTIPLGIDIPERRLSATGAADTVLFVGGYGHQPNAEAALRLIKSIMPLARAHLPEVKLVLVGDQPTREMLATATELDEITGTVERVEPFIDRAGLLALPISYGGGMRVKTLEALAVGKAVVASPLAAAGLDVEDGRQMIRASSDEEFADAIVKLLQDESLRARLGHEARDWAEANLPWNTRVDQYRLLYASLLEARRAEGLAGSRPSFT